MPCEIINLKYYKGTDYQHIGRSSIFGNPFEISRDGNREEVIEKYRQWFNLLLKDNRFKKEVFKLRNQKLGCWCKEPDKEVACHGDIIKSYVDNLPEISTDKFKLGVCGSRGWIESESIYRVLDKNINKIEMIVSGGCKNSPDETARMWAEERGVPILIYYPKWKNADGTTDKGAGFRRNRFIVEASDKIVAWRLAMSKGTSNTIRIAQEMGKPVTIFDRDII